jgi:cold shock CspA family protein
MRGKILFFSEEKGFGKIIDSGKNEYFFYINKIKNKPEEINKDDEVEFEYYESPKGLRATNIYFFEKIECPICNTLNYENDKNCKNIKCNWDLKYVKNGSMYCK